MVHSFLEGKTAESRDLFFKYFDLVKVIMSSDVNPVGIKAVLALCGQIQEEYRLPLVPIGPEGRETLRKKLEQSGLLAAGNPR
jgi:dihydrodipicolinate synthase/N-acetylneuraminate lyase